MTLRCLWMVGLVGCVPPLESGERLVSPFDGEDGVPLDAELRLVGYARTLAPGSVPADLIQVLSLDEGGFLSGEVVREGADLLFVPEMAWEADRTYHWHINETFSPPRTVEWKIGPMSAGDLSFSTVSRVRPIEMTATDTGLCVTFSSRLQEVPLLVIEVAGAAWNPTWTLLGEEELSPLSTTPERSLSVLCSVGLPDAGDVRIAIGDGTTLRNVGPEERVEDVILRRRRGVLP